MSFEELRNVLKSHRKWLNDEGGKRADLRNADLRNADLGNANLWNAKLRGADLRYANLRGADLRGAEGILTFIGEHHQIIYYRHNDEHRAQIGCKDLPIEEWLKNFESIGKEENYPKQSIKLYGEVLKLFSNYDLGGE